MVSNLTDLINQNATAYELFYALSPQMQSQLQTQEIHSLEQLQQAVADLDSHLRPAAF